MSNTPHFPLKLIQEAATSEDTLTLSRGASRDAINLGYTFDDVQEVLASLKPQDFHKAHDYPTYQADAYRCRWEKNGHTDYLYIKLTLRQDGHWVATVLSFHRKR